MARAFHVAGDRVTARLDTYEVALLRDLVEQVVGIVKADAANVVTDRLFPAASPDPEVASDLRDLLHDDLREAKLANARAFLASLPDDGRVPLDVEAADQWLAALNDVRLALGTAIGVTEDDEEPDDEDAERHLYVWLTYLQDSLLEALSRRGVGG